MTVPAWQEELGHAFTSVQELCLELGLQVEDLSSALAAHSEFPLRVPRGFVARMRPGDPRDPLLLQVLPIGRELEIQPGYSKDPLGEDDATASPGLLHKYQGRVLVISTGACAIHCRYCFRRHFPYAEQNLDLDSLKAYLAADPSIHEVILSGGDPLALSDRRLARLVETLDRIPHVKRLRLHTRVPIVLPERVDENLLNWLEATRLQTVIVLHSNHANEIDDSVATALAHFRRLGIQLLNQTVLLAGVNDSVDNLSQLSEKLFERGVLPYYLHLLDPVQGAGHFAVDEKRAQELLGALMKALPGYLVPKLVREQKSAPAKITIPPSWLL
jgi:L-lysine 2,3-aminomutase